MGIKARLKRLEQRARPEQRIVLVDSCDPPHWMISGQPEMHQGEPDLRESDHVVGMGNICLEAL